jgi:hypothetical protein
VQSVGSCRLSSRSSRSESPEAYFSSSSRFSCTMRNDLIGFHISCRVSEVVGFPPVPHVLSRRKRIFPPPLGSPASMRNDLIAFHISCRVSEVVGVVAFPPVPHVLSRRKSIFPPPLGSPAQCEMILSRFTSRAECRKLSAFLPVLTF